MLAALARGLEHEAELRRAAASASIRAREPSEPISSSAFKSTVTVGAREIAARRASARSASSSTTSPPFMSIDARAAARGGRARVGSRANFWNARVGLEDRVEVAQQEKVSGALAARSAPCAPPRSAARCARPCGRDTRAARRARPSPRSRAPRASAATSGANASSPAVFQVPVFRSTQSASSFSISAWLLAEQHADLDVLGVRAPRAPANRVRGERARRDRDPARSAFPRIARASYTATVECVHCAGKCAAARVSVPIALTASDRRDHDRADRRLADPGRARVRGVRRRLHRDPLGARDPGLAASSR